jgi:hypothetical protein
MVSGPLCWPIVSKVFNKAQEANLPKCFPSASSDCAHGRNGPSFIDLLGVLVGWDGWDGWDGDGPPMSC